MVCGFTVGLWSFWVYLRIYIAFLLLLYRCQNMDSWYLHFWVAVQQIFLWCGPIGRWSSWFQKYFSNCFGGYWGSFNMGVLPPSQKCLEGLIEGIQFWPTTIRVTPPPLGFALETRKTQEIERIPEKFFSKSSQNIKLRPEANLRPLITQTTQATFKSPRNLKSRNRKTPWICLRNPKNKYRSSLKALN